MRSTLIGVAAAAAVGISLVALPQAIAAHSSTSTPRVASITRLVADTPNVTTSKGTTSAATLGPASYPVNVTSISIGPKSAHYGGPATVTFSGVLRLNHTLIKTSQLRIFSTRDHAVVAIVSTNAKGEWHAKFRVKQSDLIFAMFSGSTNYQPALSNISRISIGNRSAAQL